MLDHLPCNKGSKERAMTPSPKLMEEGKKQVHELPGPQSS